MRRGDVALLAAALTLRGLPPLLRPREPDRRDQLVDRPVVGALRPVQQPVLLVPVAPVGGQDRGAGVVRRLDPAGVAAPRVGQGQGVGVVEPGAHLLFGHPPLQRLHPPARLLRQPADLPGDLPVTLVAGRLHDREVEHDGAHERPVGRPALEQLQRLQHVQVGASGPHGQQDPRVGVVVADGVAGRADEVQRELVRVRHDRGVPAPPAPDLGGGPGGQGQHLPRRVGHVGEQRVVPVLGAQVRVVDVVDGHD